MRAAPVEDRIWSKISVGDDPDDCWSWLGALRNGYGVNRPCCNPMHLIRGTRQQNVDDMIRRGRHMWQRALRAINAA